MLYRAWFILIVLGGALTVSGQDTCTPEAFLVDPPTIHCLGFRWYVQGDDDGDAAVTVAYRKAVVRNNLFLANRRYSMETGSPDRRTTLDYDGYRKTDDPERFIKWEDWQGRYERYPTLAAFAAGTGHEQHGILVDYDVFGKCPVPVEGQTSNPNAYDLRIKEGSAPIDAAEPLPNINDTYAGSAPDIGCREFGAPQPRYGPDTPVPNG